MTIIHVATISTGARIRSHASQRPAEGIRKNRHEIPEQPQISFVAADDDEPADKRADGYEHETEQQREYPGAQLRRGVAV